MTSSGSSPNRRDRSRARTGRGGQPPGRDVTAEIVAATSTLLKELLPDDIAVEDILVAAGVSRGAFYRYFESKYAVFAVLAESSLRGVYDTVWRPALADLWTSGPPDWQHAESVLRGVLTETFRAAVNNRVLWLAGAQGWRGQPGLYTGWANTLERHAAEVGKHIEQARQAGHAPPGPAATALGSHLMWMNEVAVYRFLLTGRDTDEEAVSALATAFLRTIYGVLPS